MSGDDKRKLGKIQLERKLIPRQEAAPPSSSAGQATPPSSAVRPQPAPVAPPAVDLGQLVIASEHLLLVPRPAAEALAILPIGVRGDVVVVAMADPADRRAIDELEFATGKTVSPLAVARELLLTAIADAYDAAERGDPEYRGPRAPPSSAVRPRTR